MIHSIEHDPSLDNDPDLQAQTEYYDSATVSDDFDISQATLKKARIKRVNMGIPYPLYKEAQSLGIYTGSGYQNTMKMALAIGLRTIRENL